MYAILCLCTGSFSRVYEGFAQNVEHTNERHQQTSLELDLHIELFREIAALPIIPVAFVPSSYACLNTVPSSIYVVDKEESYLFVVEQSSSQATPVTFISSRREGLTVF